MCTRAASFICIILVSCAPGNILIETQDENEVDVEVMVEHNKDRRIINPYAGIDFERASRVKAVSHEHIFTEKQLKTAYDRGIRYFACVNYSPACPSYPLSNWSFTYQDYVSTTNLTLTSISYSGSIPSFIDKEGNTIYTDELVQLPNAEHAFYAGVGAHFNVLGSLFGECTNGIRRQGEWSEESLGMRIGDWYNQHPKWDINDVNRQYLKESNQLFPGKVFGTINHTYDENNTRYLLDTCPEVFKAIEAYNQGSSASKNARFRKLWDSLLREGRHVWGTSAIDWQKDNRLGACNVLLINNYEDQPLIKKAEMGLDAYIAGAFLAAGLADNDVISLYNDENSIHIQVSGNPTTMKLITNRGEKSFNKTNRIDYWIEDDVSYVRFEIWYYDNDSNLRDYLFTNPIFIE